MFACMQQDHKVMLEEDIGPNFEGVKISNVKHSSVSNIYHDQMDIMEQASANFLMSIFI